MLKFTSIADAEGLTRQELREVTEADKVLEVAKLSNRNLIKPGPMVSKMIT